MKMRETSIRMFGSTPTPPMCNRHVPIIFLLILLFCAGCATRTPTVSTPARQSTPDPVRAIALAASADARLVRIEADFNNDGFVDLALATSDSCGNKICTFDVFLRRPDDGYFPVGQVGSLPFGYGISPLSAGHARFETCSASGDVVLRTWVIISTDGLSQAESAPFSATDAASACQRNKNYTWTECPVSEYLRTNSCQWLSKTWP